MDSSFGPVKQLSPFLIRQRLAGRVKYLKVVDSWLGFVFVGPHQFFVPIDLDQAHLVFLRMMAGDDRVAIGKALNPASVIDQAASQIRIVNLPNQFALGIDLYHQIFQGATNESIAIGEADRGKRPIGRLNLPNDFTLGGIFADHFVQQLGHEVIAVL